MSFEVQLSRQQLVYSRYSSHPEKLLSSRGNFSKLLLQKSNELSETYIETRHLKSRDWTAVFITHFGSFRGKARWISEWREIISLVSAGIAQWLERSSPTSMTRVQFLPVPYVGWVCCWISLCSEGFHPGCPVFLPTQKSTLKKISVPPKQDPHKNQLKLMWLPL